MLSLAVLHHKVSMHRCSTLMHLASQWKWAIILLFATRIRLTHLIVSKHLIVFCLSISKHVYLCTQTCPQRSRLIRICWRLEITRNAVLQ